MSHTSRTLQVAAIQSVSHAGDAAANLTRAEKLIAEAAEAGAELAICPEFLAPGYVWDRSMWRDAEPRGGRTERWLSRLAARHSIYLGAGYLEIEGEDFFNAFALAGPDGAIVGRVRKQARPAYEGWVFRSCEMPKTFESPLGRIGVGICADNHTRRFFERMLQEQPDLLLMPHSAPFKVPGDEIMRSIVGEIGPFYAESFGIPTVVANKAAASAVFTTPVPTGDEPMSMQFPGMSTIADSDGELRAQLPDAEGVICAEVTLAPERKRTPSPPTHFYWARTPRKHADAVATAYIELERLAERAYADAREQRMLAIEELARASERSEQPLEE
jgi:N-carbamoylputrescine amidase